MNSPEAPKLTGGYQNVCYLKDGSVKCWGHNSFGDLGSGSASEMSLAPLPVVGLQGGVSAVDAGMHFACAIKSSALFCWGFNRYGQLGNNIFADEANPVPQPVANMQSGVTKVTSGNYMTCAIKNGAAYCWGYNGYGQVGSGSTDNKNAPVPVVDMTSGVTDITTSTGDELIGHTCAIKNGAAYCWGNNSYSQLGDGSSNNSSTPRLVSGLDSGVTHIVAGGYHTCAIKNAKIYCWGENYRGQLGIGSTDNTPRAAPTLVGGLLAGKTIADLKVGRSHTCAVSGGQLYCWGMNVQGQIGVGDNVDRFSPVAIADMTDVVALSCSTNATHVFRNGYLYSFGFNQYGQLGVNDTTDRLVPTQGFSF